MKTETFDLIRKKKLLNRLRSGFERKIKFRDMLKDKEKAITFLNSLATILPKLLEPLFMKEESK